MNDWMQFQFAMCHRGVFCLIPALTFLEENITFQAMALLAVKTPSVSDCLGFPLVSSPNA